MYPGAHKEQKFFFVIVSFYGASYETATMEVTWAMSHTSS